MIEAIGQTQKIPDAFGGLGPDTFLQLLVAQLRYQNPLEPMKPADMMQQTAQLTTVEMLTRLASVQQQLLELGRLTAAEALIGRTVTGVSLTGRQVTGAVEGIVRQADRVLLKVDGWELDVDTVREVEN